MGKEIALYVLHTASEIKGHELVTVFTDHAESGATVNGYVVIIMIEKATDLVREQLEALLKAADTAVSNHVELSQAESSDNPTYTHLPQNIVDSINLVGEYFAEVRHHLWITTRKSCEMKTATEYQRIVDHLRQRLSLPEVSE